MARLLSKVDLDRRFKALSPEMGKLTLRRLRNTTAAVVNDEGDEVAAQLSAAGLTATTDTVADVVAGRWVADVVPRADQR